MGETPRHNTRVPEEEPLYAVWADERAGMGGEEHEHSLYFDPDDVDALGIIQVWDDATDEGTPVVGFFAREHSGPIEFRWDMTPDQALDLASYLVVHALGAREAALERASDDA